MANNIKGITVEIGGDTTGLSKALQGVNTEIKNTQSTLREVEKLLKLDPTDVEALTQKQKYLTKEIEQTEDKLKTLETAAEQANTAMQNGEISEETYDALKREVEKTKIELDNLKTAADETAQKLDSTKNVDFNSLETEISDVTEEVKELAEESENAADSMSKIDSITSTLSGVGTAATNAGTKLTTGVTVPILAAGTGIVATASDFETSMSKVQALIGSSSSDIGSDMQMLENVARSAGENTIFSASEAADAMSYMALAGWNANEMSAGLGGVLDLAASSNLDLATASDIVTDYLTAFGMSADQSGELVDTMAYAMSSSNTTTEQLGEAYKNCATTATQLGWDVEDVTSALMVMANNGSKGGEAGTALNSIMTRLANNTSGCADLLAEYGIEVYDSAGNLNDLGEIITGMQGVWGDLNDEEKANLGYLVAGKTAESELMAVLGDTSGALGEYTEGINNSSGTANQMASVMQDNLSGQLTMLKSKLQEVALQLSEALMPTIEMLVDKIQGAVEWFSNLDDGTKKTIVKIAAVVAAIGPALTAFGKITTGISDVIKIGGKLKPILTALLGAFGGISAPILAIVAVVGTLVAAFMTLWNTNEDFRNSITEIWNNIKETVGGFFDGIVERVNALGFDFTSFSDMLKSAWQGLCNFIAPVFTTTFNTISVVLQTAVDVIMGIVDIFIGLFTGNWSQVWDGVKEIFGGVWDGICGIFSNIVDNIINGLDAFLGLFGTSWEELWNGIKTFFENIWNGIVDFFTTIIEFIVDVVTTYWETIRSAIETALNAISDTVSKVWEAIKTAIETVLETISNVITTYWDAIKDAVSTAVNAVKTTVSTVFNAIKQTVSTIVGTIKSTVTEHFGNLKDAIESKITAAKDAVSEILGKIKEKFKELITAPKEWAKDMIDNFIQGIKDGVGKVKDAVGSLCDTVKDFLGFSLPEKGPLSDADTYMPDMIDLLSEGIESSKGKLLSQVKGLAAEIGGKLTDVSMNAEIAPFTAGINGGTGGNVTNSTNSEMNVGGINIVINGANIQNDNELATMVADKINNTLLRTQAVYR